MPNKDGRKKVFSELVILVVKENGALSEVDGYCTCTCDVEYIE